MNTKYTLVYPMIGIRLSIETESTPMLSAKQIGHAIMALTLLKELSTAEDKGEKMEIMEEMIKLQDVK